MRDLVILFVHVIATLARLLGPGGLRSVVAESVFVRRQLLILNRSRQRSPNLRTSDRLGFRHPNRQRRGSKDSRQSLSAGKGLRRSILADLILSQPPAALRQCDSPHLGSKVTGRIGQYINSPGTGSPNVIRCPSGVRIPNSLSPQGLFSGSEISCAPRVDSSR